MARCRDPAGDRGAACRDNCPGEHAALDGGARAAMLTLFDSLSTIAGRLMAVARRSPQSAAALRELIFGATLIAGLCCWPAPSEAYIEHPWCTTARRSGGLSCGFDSYEHCMENARLLTQTNCVANPWIDPLPQAPPHAHARGADARRR
jgi:hypothetical protein